jgi:hypothetical protein
MPLWSREYAQSASGQLQVSRRRPGGDEHGIRSECENIVVLRLAVARFLYGRSE